MQCFIILSIIFITIFIGMMFSYCQKAACKRQAAKAHGWVCFQAKSIYATNNGNRLFTKLSMLTFCQWFSHLVIIKPLILLHLVDPGEDKGGGSKASTSTSYQGTLENQHQIEYDCVICGQTMPSTLERPIGLVTLLQASSGIYFFFSFFLPCPVKC